ncbi:tyrosine-type recombinase/integrase [Chitinophaga sp. GCM10012297]|uniref:Site-specific integrase n=1 Tax=Chitinophaga chungangae TaxID=2821488 RepID=A0ABS3YHE3_9BACT|nr:site-specific integrase [Chitinophaga chungangae]MBO9154101.1 site-specific integrase [Chitinophaga chungangae]
MTFGQYLQSKAHSVATICTYEKYLSVFTDWLQSEYIHPDGVCYEELLEFMRWLQAGGRSRETVAMLLCVVRHFYDWRIAIKATGSNPAAGVYIKGIPRRLPAGMLDEETLHELYKNYCALYASTLCGRVILGLLVFQGLTVREIRQLEITDVRLEEGMLYVRGGRTYNGRRLKLDAAQVRQLEHCVRVHGKLSKPAMRGMRLLNGHYLREEVSRLLKALKTLHPAIRSVQQIRGSVITEWLGHYNVRQVQYMAGHKYASSTQRYQLSGLEDLQAQLDQHHPIEIGIHSDHHGSL